jgi:hypothetical protein
MACYKPQGFLQIAEPLTALTALGLGQRMFGLRIVAKRAYLQGSSKFGGPFLCAATPTFGFTSVEANELRAMLAEVRKLG